MSISFVANSFAPNFTAIEAKNLKNQALSNTAACASRNASGNNKRHYTTHTRGDQKVLQLGYKN